MQFLKDNRIILVFLIFILSLPAFFSLFHRGFFPSHDGEWMIIRLTDFHRSFVSGQIPVRWAARLNHQYGYPIFNFLYPFPFYLGEIFYLLSGSFIWAAKLVFILSFFLSAVFMYLWINEEFGRLAGLISAVLYVYTPYRFLDVYVRGSIGESLAFIFPPLIFYSLRRLEKKQDNIFLAIGSLAVAGLITSHNTAAMLFTFIFLGYLIFYWLIFRKKMIFWKGGAILFLGLIISCFFWLPALYETKFVYFKNVLVSNFFAHFPTLRQLLIPYWGYGPSLPLSDQDTLSFQVGVVNLGIFLITFLILIKKILISRGKEEFIRVNFLLIYFCLVFLFSFFMMTEFSFWVWRASLIYNLIQFPWRLLSLTTFSSAILGGGLIWLTRNRQKAIFWVALVILPIIFTYKYARPEYFVGRGEGYYLFNEGTTTVANEYLPLWVKTTPTERPSQKVEIISGKGRINNLNFNSRKIVFDVESEDKNDIQINIIYYPGWEVKIDGQKTLFNYQNQSGLIRFSVERGVHKIVAEFRETPLRKLANMASILGLVIMVGIIAKRG